MGRISPIDSANQQSDIPTNGLLSQTLPEPSGSLLSRTSTSNSPTRTPLSSNSRSNLSVLPSVGSPQKNHVLENSTSSHSKGAPHADENSHQVAPLSESSSSNSHQVVPLSGTSASGSSQRAPLPRTNGSSRSSTVGTEQFCDGEETKTTPVSTRGGGEVTGGNRQGGARQRSSDSTGSLRRSKLLAFEREVYIFNCNIHQSIHYITYMVVYVYMQTNTNVCILTSLIMDVLPVHAYRF